MDWYQVEQAVQTYVKAQWALTSYATTWPLYWENENQQAPKKDFIYLSIEGVHADKSVYGSVGKRLSVEHGIIFYHAFGQVGGGKIRILQPISTMSNLLELQTLGSGIDCSGAEPPAPAQPGRLDRDIEMSVLQPEGNYYRVSASVPFIVRGAK